MNIEEVYAKGRVAFMGVELVVAAGALIPREETELLGKTALDVIAEMGAERPRIIDMCCGSGNLACGIASALPRARVWGSDVTDGCTSLARHNVEHLGLKERVNIHQGDLFAGLAGLCLEGTIDVVVCNPPYISEKRLEGDRAELLAHEPREAFVAGPYALTFHQRVVKEALPFLRKGGFLLFEIGLGQDRQVKILFDSTKAYTNTRLVPNAAGELRVILGQTLGTS